MARPPKRVDEDLVFKVARLGCTQEEVADIAGISVRTLQRRFTAVLVRARAHARMSIRRAQYVRAIRDRSDRMLIWLGRVELNQVAGGDRGGDLAALLEGLASDEEG